MAQPIHVVILAAGQGTRMKSALPKVLHAVGGKPMLGHVLDAASAIGAARRHVVHGHGAQQVRERFASEQGLEWVLQAEQLGTAHAVLQAMPQVPDAAQVLVLYGDTPLIRAATLQHMVEAGAGKHLAMLTVNLSDPTGYGRILRNARGAVTGVVEEKDANAKQRKIAEVNTGVIAAPAKKLRAWLKKVGNKNAKGEYYLTDIVALAVKDKVRVVTVAAPDPDEVEGANDRAQLARLERVHQQRQAAALMRDGLGLADPARFDLRGTLRHGRDVRVDVGCVFEGQVELGDDVVIGPYCVLRDVRIGAGTQVQPHSVLEHSVIGENCRIGPFARIRPESQLGRDVHVGNFVELKKARLDDGAKANHLAYVGDAQIGARTNIGAGVITVNYDGAHKHQTVVGADAFVGSDVQLIAPVSIGDGATVGAGSTITRDVPAGGLTLCRAREQKTFPNWKRPRK